MIEYMRQYYLDERNGGIYALAAGVIYVVVGAWLWNVFAGNALCRGMAMGFLVSSVLALAIGAGSYFYNSNKLTETEVRRGESEQLLQREEVARMDKVLRVTFPNAFRTFAVLMAIALSTIIFNKNEYWKGIGIALMVLTTLLVVFDSFSQQRNRAYQVRIMDFFD